MQVPKRIVSVPLGVASGAGYLARGLAFWTRRPGVMLLGLVPAAIVALVLAATLVALAFGLDPFVAWLTPFADSWSPGLRTVLRLSLAVVVFLALGTLAIVTFTSVTLLVGDPFYERVRRAVDVEAGGVAPYVGVGFGDQLLDVLRAVGLGVATAIAVGLVGLIPLVGGVLGAGLAVVLGGNLLGGEIVGRALSARGFGPLERAQIIKGRRRSVLGLGIAVQLCFALPLGAILVMPVAVAGGTLLARKLLGEPDLPPRRAATAARQLGDVG